MSGDGGAGRDVRVLQLAPLWLALSWVLVAAAAYLSLGPAEASEAVWVLPFPYHDKLGHFLAYSVMMLWFAGLYRRSRWLLIAQFLLLFGLLMELTQGRFDHRSMDFGDVVANTAGIATGLALAWAGLDRWCQVAERVLVRGR